MSEILQSYLLTIWSLLAVGGLLLVQLLVADVVGLTRGHVPGSTLTSSHDDFHFRATRAHANTNESIASFVLLVLASVALGGSPLWINSLSAVYCLSRLAHMLFYWCGLTSLRSLSFIASLGALFGLVLVGVIAAI